VSNSASPELVASDGRIVAPDASTSPISIHGLTVSYGSKPAVFSVDADMPAETMTAIIGPNGAGKSTLLKGALGIVPKVSGEVLFFGQPFNKARRRIAYVPQRASVDWDFPARVIDVVIMGLYADIGLLRFAGARHRKTALDCLEQVGMADFASRQIGQLSGGQQQRVFLARSLAQNADLYLLDEPFAGVDAATEKAIVTVLKTLNAQKRTVVCVHHDLSTVTEYFDRILFVNVRKIAEGSTSDVFTEENLQATYGGRLASTHIEDLRLSAG
jgi:manganese/zinc/iron transport system ATP- binding protein